MDSADDDLFDDLSHLLLDDLNQTEDPADIVEETTRVVEIFRVVYLGHDEITPDKQLGTINVNDNLLVHDLYNVDKVDMTRPSIQHRDEIMLTGPTVAPIIAGITEFNLDLFDGNYKDRMHFNLLPSPIEFEPLKRIIKSKDRTGGICVLYSIFEDVTSANVEFTLIEIESTSQVYGIAAASTSKIEDPEFTSILFLNKPEHTIKLGPGDRIPLSRSLVAVPLDSLLYLDVHLCDDKNEEIVKGSVEFSPESESSELIIYGKKGKIKVNVTWKSVELTSADKTTREDNAMKFILKFLNEAEDQPGLTASVCPL